MKLMTSITIVSLNALAACQSTGSQTSSPTVNDLQRLNVELVDGQTSVRRVATTLDALAEKGGNLDAEFTAYSDAVDDVASMAERVHSIRQRLAESSQLYLRDWQDSSASIRNANLKTRSTARRDAVAADFDGLRSGGDGLRSEFDALLLGLTDTRKYLAFDLNPSGVASMQGDLGSLKTHADELDEHMGSFVSELNELMAAIAVPATAGA